MALPEGGDRPDAAPTNSLAREVVEVAKPSQTTPTMKYV
jgi:hypothetical protein